MILFPPSQLLQLQLTQTEQNKNLSIYRTILLLLLLFLAKLAPLKQIEIFATANKLVKALPFYHLLSIVQTFDIYAEKLV